MIIGICGSIGSGKDTIAQYLVDSRDYVRMSMASTLKDATAILFGWDREMLEGKTAKSRMEREQPDPFWSERLGVPFSPRYALQYFGTDLFRNNLHQDIWVIATERALLGKENAVISDIRFPNEIEMIKKRGGQIWRVKRGPDPEWWNAAVEMPSSMQEKYPNVHNSEWAWVNTKFDFVFDNDSSLDVLYKNVERYISAHELKQ